ncbi:MAG: hypothetical protein Q8P39_03800 [Candidatus Yanofskybacteria bacterium]|nr:hypothetical protein [Candidatus Yanofskybacteria bacterium]
MSQKIIIGIVSVLLLAAAGTYYWFAQRNTQERVPAITPLEKEETSGGLGGELYKNPAERVPETNPFQTTNPFSGKTNPFE